MLLEVEVKYPVPDLTAIRQSLAALGAAFAPAVEQMDLYFAHPSRDFRETDEALRIRRTGHENVITYKGPKLDATTKTRHEIELPLPSGESGYLAFAELLEVLGFRRVFEVRKQRLPGSVTWDGSEVHLALDSVAGLGEFVELEIVAEERAADSARERLLALARRLQLSQPERRGYLDLLLRELGLNH